MTTREAGMSASATSLYRQLLEQGVEVPRLDNLDNYREALQTAQRGADIARQAGQEDFLKSLNEGIEDYSNSKPRGG